MKHKHTLHHLTIVVPDLEAALASFRPFDPEPERHLLESTGIEIGVVRIGPTELHLIHPLRDDAMPAKDLAAKGGPFVHHIGVGVESIDDEMERLAGLGMPPVSEPQLTAPGLREVFVQFPSDATGVEIQLVEDKQTGKTQLIDEGVSDAIRSVRRENA